MTYLGFQNAQTENCVYFDPGLKVPSGLLYKLVKIPSAGTYLYPQKINTKFKEKGAAYWKHTYMKTKPRVRTSRNNKVESY